MYHFMFFLLLLQDNKNEWNCLSLKHGLGKKSVSSFILRNKNPDSSIVNPGLAKKVHVRQCFPTRFPETSFCTLGDNVSRDSGNNFGLGSCLTDSKQSLYKVVSSRYDTKQASF